MQPRQQANGRGDLFNLSQALLELCRAYVPSPEGPCAISDVLQVSLPYPEWHQYCWHELGTTPAIAIGSSAAVTLFTVPRNERAYLESVRLQRLTGDNNAALISVTYPVGYFDGTATCELLRLSPAAGEMYWPDAGGDQSMVFGLPGHLLVEPGTLVGFTPDGAGSATSTFRYSIQMRRMKLVRSLAP